MTTMEMTSEQVLDSMPFAVTIGVTVVMATAREVVLKLPWAAERCTIGGVLHGGSLMTLADSAGAVCAFLNLPEGATGTTTVESSTRLLRAVRDGVVTATATALHAGRRTIVVQTNMHDDNGKLVAQTTQTQAVL